MGGRCPLGPASSRDPDVIRDFSMAVVVDTTTVRILKLETKYCMEFGRLDFDLPQRNLVQTTLEKNNAFVLRYIADALKDFFRLRLVTYSLAILKLSH